MSTFFRHKKTLTCNNLKQLSSPKANISSSKYFNHFSKSSVQTHVEQSSLLRKESVPEYLQFQQKKMSSKWSSFTRFPKEQDFLKKHQQPIKTSEVINLNTQVSSIKQRQHQTLKKLPKRSQIQLLSFPSQSDSNTSPTKWGNMKNQKMIMKSFNMDKAYPNMNFRNKKLDSEVIVDSKTEIKEHNKEETEATMTFQEQISEITRENTDDLVLTMEINSLLQRSQIAMNKQNEEQSKKAIIQLQKLLSF